MLARYSTVRQLYLAIPCVNRDVLTVLLLAFVHQEYYSLLVGILVSFWDRLFSGAVSFRGVVGTFGTLKMIIFFPIGSGTDSTHEYGRYWVVISYRSSSVVQNSGSPVNMDNLYM